VRAEQQKSARLLGRPRNCCCDRVRGETDSMRGAGERRGWRSQSVRRSPPWAPSLNPYSMTAARTDSRPARPSSPLPVLPKMSGDEVEAAVDGFEVPQDLLDWGQRRLPLPLPKAGCVGDDGAAEDVSLVGARTGNGGARVQPGGGGGGTQCGPRVVATLQSNGRRASKLDCESLQNALALANKGAPGSLLHARAGLHEWEGDLLVQASSCNVTAGLLIRFCVCACVRACVRAAGSTVRALMDGSWMHVACTTQVPP